MGKGRESEGDAILYEVVKGSLREKGAVYQRSEWRERASVQVTGKECSRHRELQVPRA